eukprot:TRINITY_DN67910_c2_g7_i1.p1 TRINITY_DN67910_c2_g7~~TRINITY_DN67910_c2_g7_i1.p1  ORF type:complete len:677 (-),score=19.42 TRINITY_DN67910_c2_g7_i1:204-2234(-)
MSDDDDYFEPLSSRSRTSPVTPKSSATQASNGSPSSQAPSNGITELMGSLVHVVSRHPHKDCPRLLSAKPGGWVCLSKDLSENEVWQIKQIPRATKKRQPYVVVQLCSFWHSTVLCAQQTETEPKRWILKHKHPDEVDEGCTFFKLLPSRVVAERKSAARGALTQSKRRSSIKDHSSISSHGHSLTAVPPLQLGGGGSPQKSLRRASLARHATFATDQPTGRTEKGDEESAAEKIDNLIDQGKVNNAWLLRCDFAQDWLQQVVRFIPKEGLLLGEILKNDTALLWEFVPAQICNYNKVALTRHIPAMGSVVTITSAQGQQYLSAKKDGSLGLNDLESDREGWMLQVQQNGTVVIYSLSYASAVVARQNGEVKHVQLGQRTSGDLPDSHWEFLYDSVCDTYVIRSRFYQRLWFSQDANIQTSHQSIDQWSNWRINDSLRAKSQQELQKLTYRETKLLRSLSPMSVALPPPPLPPLRYSTPQLQNTATAAATILARSRGGAQTAPLVKTSGGTLLPDVMSSTFESLWGTGNDDEETDDLVGPLTNAFTTPPPMEDAEVPSVMDFTLPKPKVAIKADSPPKRTPHKLWPERRPESRAAYGDCSQGPSVLGVGHWSLQYTAQRKNYILQKLGKHVETKQEQVARKRRKEEQEKELLALTKKYERTMNHLSKQARATKGPE